MNSIRVAPIILSKTINNWYHSLQPSTVEFRKTDVQVGCLVLPILARKDISSKADVIPG